MSSDVVIGREVRLEGSQLWVRRRGRVEWIPVHPRQLDLDATRPYTLGTSTLGRFDLGGTGLDVRAVSRRIAAARFDPDAVRQIWNSRQSVRGDYIIVSFEGRELVESGRPREEPSDLVYPFAWFQKVQAGDPAHLVQRWKLFPDSEGIPLQGLSITPEELAQRMGVPFTR